MPSTERDAFAVQFEAIDMHQRDILSRPNVLDEFAYFPLSGICSFITVTDDNVRVETGLVGSEGFVGSAIVLQADHDPHEVMVQADGRALRIPRAALSKIFETRPQARTVLLRSIYVMGVQSAQTALVNGHFGIEVRLARWLLMCQDWVCSSFPMTHDFLSKMLAVRRAGITDALHALEGKHLIKSTRGSVSISDRLGLEALAGTAYGLPEREQKRLITPAPG